MARRCARCNHPIRAAYSPGSTCRNVAACYRRAERNHARTTPEAPTQAPRGDARATPDPRTPGDRWAGSTALLAAFPSARSLWQHDPGAGFTFTLECFQVGIILVIVQTFPGHGWEAYLQSLGNRVDVTLNEIARVAGVERVEG